MRPASFVVTWRDDARRGFQLHRRNNPSATTARTAATNAMSAPKIMSFRCRRRIAFYEVDMPRGSFAAVVVGLCEHSYELTLIHDKRGATLSITTESHLG